MRKRLSLRSIMSIALAGMLITISALAQSIVSTNIFTPPGIVNNVGLDFEASVVNSTGLVYIGTAGDGREVGVIDPNTNSLAAVIPVAKEGQLRFSRVNQTTGLVYFIGVQEPTIVAVDGRPESATFNQALPPMTLSQGIQSFSLDETRGVLYATTVDLNADPLQSQVSIIDINPASATFHQVLTTVLLPAETQVRGVAVNAATNKAYLGLAGAGLGGVYVLDGASLSLTRILGTVGSFGVIVNESENLVYASAQGNRVNVVDGATDTALAVIPVPAMIGANPSFDEKLAVHRGTGRVYVQTNELTSPGNVVVIDGERVSPTFNTVLAAIPVGRSPGSGEIAVDESLNRILTSSLLDRRTSIIDGATNSVITTIPSTQIPSDVALDPVTHRAYVANQLSFVQKIDVSSAMLSATIVTGAETGIGVVNPNNHLFYIGRTVVTADVQFFNQSGASGTVTGFPHGNGRYRLTAINRQTNRIYVANDLSNLAGDIFSLPGFVSVIDGATNAVIDNIEVGNQPSGICVNEATNQIYVVNAGFGVGFSSGITVIDGAANTPTNADTSAFAPGATFILNVVANETTNKIYFQVNSGAQLNIGVLNGATGVAIPLPAALGPVSAIAVNKVLNRVYVVSGSTGLLHVLDGTTDTEIATLTIGSPSSVSDNIAVNESTGKVFVSNLTDDTLVVIDGANNTIGATIAVGDGPRPVAVNSLANRIYVGNNNDKTISFIDGESLVLKANLAVPLGLGYLSVDAAVSRLYASGDDKTLSGVQLISDVGGTFDALGQVIMAATVGDPPAIRNSLLSKADSAKEAFDRGNTQAGINKLHALENEVEAQRGKRLTNVEADHILALISAVINSA